MVKKDNTDDLNLNAGRNAQGRGRDGDVNRRITRLQSSDTRGRGSSRGNGNRGRRGGRGGRGAHKEVDQPDTISIVTWNVAGWTQHNCELRKAVIMQGRG